MSASFPCRLSTWLYRLDMTFRSLCVLLLLLALWQGSRSASFLYAAIAFCAWILLVHAENRLLREAISDAERRRDTDKRRY